MEARKLREQPFAAVRRGGVAVEGRGRRVRETAAPPRRPSGGGDAGYGRRGGAAANGGGGALFGGADGRVEGGTGRHRLGLHGLLGGASSSSAAMVGVAATPRSPPPAGRRPGNQCSKRPGGMAPPGAAAAPVEWIQGTGAASSAPAALGGVAAWTGCGSTVDSRLLRALQVRFGAGEPLPSARAVPSAARSPEPPQLLERKGFCREGRRRAGRAATAPCAGFGHRRAKTGRRAQPSRPRFFIL